MKLVNGFDLMEFAKKHHHVLPAFNTTNLEMTKGTDGRKAAGIYSDILQ